MTIEQLTTLVETLETESEAAMALGMLQARIAGVKSRYKSLGFACPAEVDAAYTEVCAEIAKHVAEAAAPIPV